jgi:hypothetical protein
MAPQPCKAKLEDVWRLRLDEAAKRHKIAKANCLKVLEEFTSGLTVSPEGSQVVRQATSEQDAAREDHLRVLDIFTDLVVRRKFPDEQ